MFSETLGCETGLGSQIASYNNQKYENNKQLTVSHRETE